MKKISFNIFIGYIVFLLFIAFIPIKNLYFLGQEELLKKNIFVNESSISTFFVSTTIEGATFYFEDIKALNAKSIGINIFGLYNSFYFEDINIDKALKDFLPLKIQDLSIVYSILYPTKAFISGEGDFGVLEGYVDLINKKVFLSIDASSLMKKSFNKLLSMMKTIKDKNHKNRYIYEYNL
jgi:hypothetical protein